MAITVGGYKGFGTTLSIKISSSFTVIGNVLTITPPEVKVGKRETTNLASTARTYRPTIPDYGMAKFTIQYDMNDTATHTILMGRLTTPGATLDEFKIAYPDGDTTPANEDFKGFIEARKVTGIDEKNSTITAELDICVTDLLTLTAGTP